MDEGLKKELTDNEINLLKDISMNKKIDKHKISLAKRLEKMGLLTTEILVNPLMNNKMIGRLTVLGKINLAMQS